MDGRQLQLEEVGRLTGLLLEGELGPDDRRRLEQSLLTDSAALEYYQDYLDVHCLLHWQHGLPEDGGESRGRDAGISEFGNLESWRFGDFGIRDSGFGVGDSGIGIRDFHVPNLQINKSPNQQISLSPLPSPLSPLTVGGPVFSYIAAMLILGVMLLSAWAYKITHDYAPSFAQNSRGSTTPGLSTPQPPEPIFVARVTGMKDCRWSDPQTETYAGAFVPLGRKYALSSGLMEITYRSGAKVILEGPCRYEVESTAGGYLALGKLTAKVESEEWRVESAEEGSRSKVQGSKTDSLATRHSPLATKSSPLSTLHSPLFSVRTPTAVVTDLGTEFGVEVKDNGETTSHVFQGMVVVRAEGLAASAASGAGPKSQIPNSKSQITLAAGQSARVEKDAETGGARITTDEKAAVPPKFVRRIYEPPKYLDLLDIVAGGNGLGRRRERGIDPISGKEDTVYLFGARSSDHNFQPVAASRFVDGVFVPDGGIGSVQLDSAAHFFQGFPRTNGKAWGSIWARAAEVKSVRRATDGRFWVQAMGYDPRFMPEKRGLLVMHPNVGITFDLEAIRQAHSDIVPIRFRALAGLADAHRLFPENANGQADLWLFVDGQLRMMREKLRPEDGALSVDEELGPSDRFLTLATTDGGNGHSNDWVVFGDPVLQTADGENENGQ